MRVQPPGDAPDVVSDQVKLPSVPPSYNELDGGWIRFAYPPEVRERVQPLIKQSEAVRSDLARRLGQKVLTPADGPLQVIVARTPGEMATFAPEGMPFPKYAAGVAYSRLRLVLLTIDPLYPSADHDLAEIYRHELAHVAIFDATAGKGVPRWFNEGFAVYASGEASAKRLQTLWTATLADTLIPLRQLARTFPADPSTAQVAYAEAADVIRFMARTQDEIRFQRLIAKIRSGKHFETALRESYGIELATLEHEWRQDVAKRYTFWPVLFSGSVVWFGAIGLFMVAWRRRRKKHKDTLDRWAKEEAEEDAKRDRQRELRDSLRVRLLIPKDQDDPLFEAASVQPVPPPVDPEVPKVEHNGSWHTLH